MEHFDGSSCRRRQSFGGGTACSRCTIGGDVRQLITNLTHHLISEIGFQIREPCGVAWRIGESRYGSSCDVPRASPCHAAGDQDKCARGNYAPAFSVAERDIPAHRIENEVEVPPTGGTQV